MGTDWAGDELALTIKCPMCKRPKGAPCVYIMPKTPAPQYTQNMQYVRQLSRAGTVMPRPHNERRGLARSREVWRTRQASSAVQLAILKASDERRRIARAQSEYDLREYDQLRKWLTFFGYLLTDL